MMFVLRLQQKIFDVCKFILDFIIPEEKFEFECRQDFFYRKNPADTIHTCLLYKKSEVKDLIYAFKYRKNPKAIEICSIFMAEKILEISKMHNLSNSVLLPVPRSELRVQKYGFDQCDLLCLEILKNSYIKKLNLMYEPNVLFHIKNIDTQTKLSRTDRIKNSQESFLVHSPEKICARKIILVDDVWTTGATVLSAEKSLIEHGASSVFKFTIAH